MPVSKWKVYNYLIKKNDSPSINLPETEKFTEKSLYKLLDKYTEIMVKPWHGSHGHGVIKISSLGEDLYEIHDLFYKNILKGRNQLFNNLMEKYIKKKYIVQQRIPLLTINNCPFDIRVIIQREENSFEWKVTGKLAKLAADGSVITNFVKEVLLVERAIERSTLTTLYHKDVLSDIDRISLLIGKELQEYYPEKRIIGLDIGLDENGKLWFIEANFNPNLNLFDSLEDKSMLQIIKQHL